MIISKSDDNYLFIMTANFFVGFVVTLITDIISAIKSAVGTWYNIIMPLWTIIEYYYHLIIKFYDPLNNFHILLLLFTISIY